MSNINLKTSNDFIGTTITGVDMQVMFGFPKEFFNSSSDELTRDVPDGDERIWFKIGTVTQIRYGMQRDATPKYSLKEMSPVTFGKGVRITQGDMVWKNFDRDAFQQVLDKLNTYEGGIDIAAINANPLISAMVKSVGDKDLENSFSIKHNIVHWDQLPLFDILCISKTSDVGSKNVSNLRIKDVKITDNGFAESIDSTEMNDIVQFVAISGVDAWKVEG